MRKVLVNALGDEKANSLMDRISLGGQRKGLEALKWMDSRAVAELIRNEHPQIIAIVLVVPGTGSGAPKCWRFLPENMRSDLIMRVATLDGVQPSALGRARRHDGEAVRGMAPATARAHRSAASRSRPKWSTCSTPRSGNAVMTEIGKTDERAVAEASRT